MRYVYQAEYVERFTEPEPIGLFTSKKRAVEAALAEARKALREGNFVVSREPLNPGPEEYGELIYKAYHIGGNRLFHGPVVEKGLVVEAKAVVEAVEFPAEEE